LGKTQLFIRSANLNTGFKANPIPAKPSTETQLEAGQNLLLKKFEIILFFTVSNNELLILKKPLSPRLNIIKQKKVLIDVDKRSVQSSRDTMNFQEVEEPIFITIFKGAQGN
jgi:hypothetical protein